MNKNTERLVVGGVALLVGLLLGWMVRGLATYNTSMESASSYNDWRVICPAASVKDASCEMSQDIQDPASHNTVARIAITKEKDKPVIGFTLPFDVSLEQGIGLQINSDPIKVFKYRTCNTVGCIVVTPADDKTVASLAGASKINMLFLPIGGENKPVAMAITNKGFTAARSAMQKGDRTRGNWFWRLWQ